VIRDSPVFILRLYEHFKNNKLSLDIILGQKGITISGKQYMLAGVTVHKINHYAAVICSKKHGDLWYDGLQGKLKKIPKDITTWSPSHALYCKRNF
jgi:hypothetical protein